MNCGMFLFLDKTSQPITKHKYKKYNVLQCPEYNRNQTPLTRLNPKTDSLQTWKIKKQL